MHRQVNTIPAITNLLDYNTYKGYTESVIGEEILEQSPWTIHVR